jgi:hypothetical protein
MIKLDPDDQESDVEMKVPTNRIPATMVVNSMEANSSSMVNDINSTNHVQNSTQINNVNVNANYPVVQPVVQLSNFVSTFWVKFLAGNLIFNH